MSDPDVGLTAWLANWYAQQCDGAWEQEFGVSLETTDHPGWSLVVDLVGTALEERPFRKLERGDFETSASWLKCWLERDQFHAACGAGDLDEMLGVFRAWAEGRAR